MHGTIRRLNDRGFGFLAPLGDDSREAEHFFHARDVLNAQFQELRPGDAVTFDSAMNEKGLAAKNVQLAK